MAFCLPKGELKEVSKHEGLLVLKHPLVWGQRPIIVWGSSFWVIIWSKSLHSSAAVLFSEGKSHTWAILSGLTLQAFTHFQKSSWKLEPPEDRQVTHQNGPSIQCGYHQVLAKCPFSHSTEESKKQSFIGQWWYFDQQNGPQV